MTEEPPRPPVQKMRWSVTAASLTAIAALYLNSGGIPLLIFITLGMLLSYIVPARLDDRTILRWIIRIALLAMVILLNPSIPTESDFAIGGARSRNLFGLFYASEILVQCWRQNADPSRARLIATAGSAMLMLTASNSFSERYVVYLAPLYLTLATFSLYDYRPHALNRRTSLLQAAALLLVLFAGFVSYRALYANKGKLTDWGNRMLGDRMRFEGTGMTAQPMLGATFDLRGSTARVLRVEQPTGDGHLRGMSFYIYREGRWGPSFYERAFAPATQAEMQPAEVNSLTSSREEMQITRLVSDNPLIFAPLNMAYFDRGESEDLEWSPESGGPIRTRVAPPYEYRVGVGTQENYQGLLANRITPRSRRRYLQIPDGFDSRIQDLAVSITKDARTAPQKIDAVTNYLISNHQYSLSINPGTADPLVGFLLSEPKKGAHCEYFAASAAMLLRCVGVPTRYVTGYLAHETLEPGVTIVRGRDAHAWCEAWVPRVGWVTVEATPGNGRPDFNPEPIERWRALTEWIQDRLQDFSVWVSQLSDVQIYVIIGGIVGGVILFWFVRYRLRRRAIGSLEPLRYTLTDRELAVFAERFEAAFARRGLPFPETKTYADHLAMLTNRPELSAENARLIEAARQFVRYYEEARFGSRTDAERRRALTELLEEMETPIR